MFIGQTKCGKTHFILELIENQYNKHFLTTLSSYAQRFEKIRKPIMLKSRSKMMIELGL